MTLRAKLIPLLLLMTAPLLSQVTYDRILHAEKEPGNWLTYSGNYSGQRYAPLDQIDAGNVARLKLAWLYQAAEMHKFETTPLVVDGIMYLSEPPSHVTALDTRTGRVLWKYRRIVPQDVRVCCGQVNRGVAALDDLLFIGTVDAHLVALDAKTGMVRWDIAVADYKQGYLFAHLGAACREGQDHYRNGRRRVRSAWLSGCLQRPYRQTGLAFPDRAGARRTRPRDLGRR